MLKCTRRIKWKSDKVEVVAEVVAMMDLGEEDQVEESQLVAVVKEQDDLILWRVTSVGCVAIWPVTVPTLVHSHRRRVVAVLALPKQVRLNPGK